MSRGDSVLVLGLGTSGLAMARACARRGDAVRVWDSRGNPPGADALRAEHPQVEVFSGELSAAHAEGVARVLKSPGLAPSDARIAPVLQAALRAGVPVLGELDLFVQALAELAGERGYAPRVLAVTGTNGKTTVTALTGLLVERAGSSVAVAGNIGPSLLDTLAEREAAGTLPEVWVLELSSFQLDGGGAGASGFEPSAAVVLNLSQDHLDWHGTMAAYAASKQRIYGPADGRTVMVVNRDDALVEAMVPQAPTAKARGAKPPARSVIRFGLDAPRRPGDFGLVVEGGMAWLVRAMPADETIKRKKGEGEEILMQRLMPADALRIRGRHNAANALAALALCSAIGLPLAPLLHGLRDYEGEPHRVQYVATVAGIEAFDDSKGTNVGATVAALDGLGADKAPGRLAVILGGDGKGQDFAPLAEPLARHARAVALIGRDAAALQAALAVVLATVPHRGFDTLQAATAWCFEQARAGDAVLLSPACASLDMFRDYRHRAEVFVEAVHAVADARGEFVG